MRLRLTIAYDGRPYKGWQVQPGHETVQGVLERAAGQLAGSPVGIEASGRTDTGVHALGQVAHFDAPASRGLAPADWQRALNSNLPPAIRILDVAEAAPDFHSRFDAIGKEYHYLIDTSEVLLPAHHGLAWHIPRTLDAGLLAGACRLFVGTHDFRNFAANRRTLVEQEPRDPVHTTRTISDISIDNPAPGRIELRFRGNGFLYKMVRLLIGSAVQCALGKADLAWLKEALENHGPGTRKSNHLAPAEGLYLARVFYAAKS